MINLMGKFSVVLVLFTSLFAQAQFGPQLTYHGRILDTNSVPPVAVTGNVTFLLQIVHPDVPTCVLYQETQTQNLTAADGNFTLTVNGGSSTLPVALLNPFADVFITDSTRTINCINGGTVPGTTNSRRLNVFFVPPGGGAVYEPLPSQAINYVPLAVEALNTNAVGGFEASSLLRVVEINGFGVPVPYAVPAITRPLYEELDRTIKGQSEYYVTSAGTVANFSGSLQGEVTGLQSSTVVSRILSRPLTTVGSTFIGGEVLYFDGANWIAKQGSGGTVQSVTSANNYLSITGAPPSNNPTIDALLTINIGTTANTVAAGDDPRIVGALQSTAVLAGDVTGLISSTVVASVGGKTAAAVATSVDATQSATSSLVNNAIVRRDGSGNVTVNTISSTNNSTRNLLLYNAGNTFNATVNVPSALAVSYTLTLPGTAPVSGFVLGTNALGQTAWVSPTAGAVTNVSATAPLSSTGGQTPVISISQATYAIDGFLSAISFTNFSNKVASVTVTAPLTIAGTSQTPLIGLQDSGVAAGTYTKVAVNSKGIITSGTTLIAADIPNLDASKITTGTLPIARGGTGVGALTGNGFITTNGAGTALASTVCAINEVPFFDGTNWICRIASSLNSSSTLVMRDNNGDFTANNITTVQDMTVQRNLRVQNGMTNYIGITTPIATPSYDIVLPNNFVAPSVNQVLSVAAGTTSSTILTTWVNALSDALASGSIFVGNASGTATGVVMNGDASISNTGNLQLSDVGAGVTSGSQYTKVTVDGKGRVTSGAQLNNADVTAGLGYTPMNSVSSTAPITISGGASNPVVGLANSGVVSGSYGSSSLIPNFVVDIFGRITSATLTTYTDATNVTKGIVNVGSNITVTAGTISVTSGNVISALGYTPFNQATSLSGDVTGTLSATVVASVGGKTSVQVSQSVSDTINATSLNSSSTIVRRDNNGDFTANNITTVQDMTVQRNLRVQNGMTNYIGITTPIATPSYDIILPNNTVAPTVGQVLSVASGSTGTVIATRWINALTDILAPGNIFVGNASGTATGVAMTGDATMSNTGNLQLVDVGAGVTSGTQYTKVTVDGKGRVTSGAQLNNADVVAGLGYVPMNSVSTTAPITLSGGASNPTIGLANSGVAASTYGSNTLVPFFTVDAFGRITSAGSQVYADATSGTKGIVSVGSNITVTTGVISVTSANIIAAMGTLGGDVSGTLNNTVVQTVGTKTALQIATTVDAVASATANNSSGTIVRRDNNGDFTANNITTVQDMTVQRNLRVQNGMTNYIGITTPIATPSYDIVLPNNSIAPTVGQVLSVASGSTGTVIATRWINALTDILAPGNIFVGNASGTAAGVALTGDATMSNTGNLQLVGVGAGVTSGTQYTKVTVDGKGRVTSGGQLNNADVVAGLGYVPMNSVSTTAPITLSGGASNPTIGLANSGVAASTYGSNTLVPFFTVDAFGRITSAGSQVYADATSGAKGIVQIGSNITVTTGVISVTSANIIAAMGTLGGDVSGTLNNTVVQTVGTKTALEIATTVDAVASATANNSSGTIVRRDAAGNFSANNITTVQDMTVQRNLRVQDGSVGGYIGLTTPIGVTSYDIVLPNNAVAPTFGQVLSVASGSTGTVIATRWINALTDILAPGNIFVGNASGTATGVALTGDATMSNTGNLQLVGVGANVTSGTQYTKVTVDGKGRVTSGAQLNNADVVAGLGYVPMNSVSTTAPITLSGGASNPTIGLANSGVAASTYGSNTLVPFFTVDAFGRITSAGSQVYADATSGAKGIVQIGSNITVSTGTISITSANVIAAMGTLGGDVSGTLNNTVVQTVGSKTALQIATTVDAVASATANNSSGTIVRRDVNGDFTANNITTVQDMTVQRNLRVQNGMTNYIGITTPIATPSYDIVLPNNSIAPTVGQVLAVASGSTGTVIATRWMNALTDALTPGFIFVGNASGTATGVALTGDATISNTGNLQFTNVGAGVISGTQYTKVTVDGKGRVTSGAQLNNADVVAGLGYTPADDAASGTFVRRANNLSDLLSSATARTNLGLGTLAVSDTLDLGSASATGIIADARLQTWPDVVSGTIYSKVTVDGKGRVTSGGQLSNADINAALGYTPMNSVSSTSPITLTGGASNPTIGLAFSGVTSGTYPKVSVDLWGRVTSGSNLAFSDVVTGLGYTPVNLVSATSPIMITGTASAPIISLANSGVIASTYGSNTLVPFFTVDAFGRITSAGAQVYADATSGTKGIVQIGSNITVSTGTISITSANVIAAMGTLGGDVSGTLNNTVVQTVGTKTALQIATTVDAVASATANNSSGTIVRRDVNGDFTANNITTVQDMTVQRNLRVQNGMTNYIGITTPIATPSYDIVLPSNAVAPSVGQILSVASGSTATTILTRWINTLTDTLASGSIFVGNAAGTATGVALTGDATISNTGNLQLVGVGAGVTSGTQYTKVTVDGKGRVTSGAQLNNADVVAGLGYTPADDAASGTFVRRANNLSDLLSSATARTNLGLGTLAVSDTLDLGSASATGIIADARLQTWPDVVSGTIYSKVTVDGKGRVTSGGQLSNADINAALGYTPMNSVSSTSPITLTGGASNPTIGLALSGVTSGTYPKVSVDLWGRVTSGSTLTLSDVVTGLGYTPVQVVSAAAPLFISGSASSPVINLQTSGVTAGTFGSSTSVPFFTVDAFGRITSAGAQAYADATSGAKGIVQIGSNITVSTGTISITSANVIAAMGTLGGDVSGTLNATIVQTVGSKTALQIATTVDAVASATANNSSGTIVRRDNNGDFTANNITTVQDMTVQRNLRVQNGMTNYIGITTPIATPSYDIVLPNNAVAPTAGQVLAVASGSTSTVINTFWVNALTDILPSGQILMGSASNTATGVTVAGDATISNTGVLTLSSVGANVTSGSQYTKVTVNGQGRVVSGGQLASADVVAALGYTPGGMVSATAPITITGGASTSVIGLANSGVAVGTYGSSFTIPIVTVDVYGRLTTISSQTLRIADSVQTGVVSIGNNITVNGAGQISLTNSNVVSALGYTPVNRAGDVMTGPLTTTALSVSQSIGLGVASPTATAMFEMVSTTKGFLLPRMTTADRNAIATPATGLQVYNTTLGAVEYYDAGWKTVLTNGSALTSLNGSASSTQIFAFGSAGTSFGVSTSTAGVHTFNMPFAASAGVTQGAITNAQYQSFLDKVAVVSGAAGQIVVTGTVSAPIVGLAPSGLTAGTYGSSSTIAVYTFDAFGRAVGIASSTLRVGSATETGVLQVGSNITVSSGTISLTSANVANAFGAGLSGDVTGSLSATVVATVGSKTALQIATTVDAVASATSANSSGTIVRRDANGNFVANNITTVQDMTVQRNLRIQNGLTNSIGIFTPIGTPDYDIILPNNTIVPPAGYGLGIASATAGQVQTTWVPLMSGSIASGAFYVGNSSGVATAVLMSGDATMSNTGQVSLSSVGANVTSGSQYTKVTVDGKGRVTSGGQLASSDVVAALGYTPGGMVSSTAPITITGGASNSVIGLANSGVAVGTYGSSFTIPVVTVDMYGRLTTISSQTLRIADSVQTGVVSIGNNITVNGAGQISLTNSNVVSALGYTPVNRAGDVMTGPLTTTALSVTNSMAIGAASATAGSILDLNSVTLGLLIPRMTTTQRNAIVSGAAQDGLQIYNTTTRALEYYDNSAPGWRQVVTNSSVVTSLNGSTSGTQFFTTGSAGTSFSVSTSTVGVHTFNFPYAASAGVTQGAITNAQYQSFLDKVATVSGVAGQIAITGTTSAPIVGLAPSGLTAGTYGSSSTIAVYSFDAFGRAVGITSSTLRLGSATETGVLQVGSNITVTTGVISLTSGNVISAFGAGLSGDVTGSLSATVVTAVGGKTSAQISQSVSDTLTATNLNTVSTIMKRDATGAVSAGAISQSQAVLRGSTAGTLTLQAPASVTSYGLIFPALQGGVSQTLINDGAGNLSWTGFMSTSLASGNVYVGNAAGVATGVTFSGDATLSNSGVVTLASTTTAGTAGSSSAIPVITYDGKGRVTSVTTTAYQDATATIKGILSVPLAGNLTVTAGAISLTSTGVASAIGTQTARTFYSGPLSGAAANPTFRTIASSDLPTTGVTGVWLNGGNSFGTTSIFGTMDNNSLDIRTNGVSRMAIDTTGNMTASVSAASFTGQAHAAVNALGNQPSSPITVDANRGNVITFTTTAAPASYSVHVTNVRAGAAYTISAIGTGANVTPLNIYCNGTAAANLASYVPANGTRVGTGPKNKTIYTFIFDGTDCLVTWITGF